MKILNFTPHPISIIDFSSVEFDEVLRKYISRIPKITTIIKSSGMLSVRYQVSNGASVNGIPIRIKKKVGIDPIPSDCDVAIVSRLYATATSDKRAYSVIDTVFDPGGRRIIGALGIGKVNN